MGKGEELFRKKGWVDSSSNLELLIPIFASAEAPIFPSIIILKPFIDKGNNSYAEQCSKIRKRALYMKVIKNPKTIKKNPKRN